MKEVSKAYADSLEYTTQILEKIPGSLRRFNTSSTVMNWNIVYGKYLIEEYYIEWVVLRNRK